MKQMGVMDVKQVAKFGDTVRDMEEGLYSGSALKIGVLSGADDEETLKKAGATHVLPSVVALLKELNQAQAHNTTHSHSPYAHLEYTREVPSHLRRIA
mmetsp:Transcript_25723/g.31182  ORF Transcript_25723/g.31182 Transcript_25723/m.31182 type:complete len:98 (-) Transcript_25723:400-693(-)